MVGNHLYQLVEELSERQDLSTVLCLIEQNIRDYSDINMMNGALRGNRFKTDVEPEFEASAQFVYASRKGNQAQQSTSEDLISRLQSPGNRFLPFDRDYNYSNCWFIGAATLGIFSTAETLKDRYFASLNRIQRSHLYHSQDSVVVSFHDAKLSATMAREGLMKEEDFESQWFSSVDSERIASAIRDSFEYILAVDPVLHEMILSLIGTIACFRRIGSSGSISSLIGFMWLNPTPEWTIVDYAENIVHEFIHNTLFLGDLVWKVFSRAHFDAPAESLVTSAILKYPRNFNIAFHSVFVAAGLSIFLSKGHQHERAVQIVAGLGVTLPELAERKNSCLTNHGREWLKILMNSEEHSAQDLVLAEG